MLKVFLLRHGQTSWNAAGNKYCGRTDIPLTAKGIEQAKAASALLAGKNIQEVYSSPLERARRTAEIAGNRKPVLTDERLIEVDFGDWEGKTRAEFIAEKPELWERWCHDPGSTRAGGTGETALEVVRRVDSFFNEALHRHGSGRETGSILVVGHNGINRLYLAWKLGMHLKDYRRLVQDNSTITLFGLDDRAEITLYLLNSQ